MELIAYKLIKAGMKTIDEITNADMKIKVQALLDADVK